MAYGRDRRGSGLLQDTATQLGVGAAAIFLVLASTIGAARGQGAADKGELAITVTNADDAGPGSYRQAIADASTSSGDDSITFDGPHEITLASSVVYTGTGALTINGNGATIDGAESFQILLAENATSVTAGDITMQKAAAGNGAAIQTGGSLAVMGATFTDSASNNSRGGALYAVGDLTITDSVFRDNQATGTFGGGAAVGDTVTVTDSVFTGNVGRARAGALHGDTELSVDHSVFIDNSTDGNGGALHSFGPLTVEGSIVIDNFAIESGGGVFSSDSATVTDSTIMDNTTRDVDSAGGGIRSFGSVALRHATVAANLAASGANVDADILSSSYSVVAEPTGGGENCVFGGSTSSGFNYDTDASCGFGAGKGDVSGGPDPLLGVLRDNGGPVEAAGAEAVGTPVPSRFPLNGSPLIDAIPTKDCSEDAALADDQRGVARPFGDGCDIGAIESVFPAHTFSDATPFFEATIRWVTSTVNTPQILNGFPNGTFGQELNITRGQAARLYYRGAGAPDASGLPAHGFSDVTPFYEDAVKWAKDAGLFNGFPDLTFRQGDPITRGQYIRSLYNFAGAQDTNGVDPHGLSDVTPFYENAVKWAKHHGLANGFPDLSFRQDDDIKRGNAARTFYNTAQTPTAWNDPDSAPPNMLFRSNLGM